MPSDPPVVHLRAGNGDAWCCGDARMTRRPHSTCRHSKDLQCAVVDLGFEQPSHGLYQRVANGPGRTGGPAVLLLLTHLDD